jgi:hypothetical protein
VAGKNPFADVQHFLMGSKPPMMLYSSEGALWELATKVTSEPPTHPPGVGIGIGGPVAVLQIVKPPGINESGFKISIYPRKPEDETGLMGVSRVTNAGEHVTEQRYLGWFTNKDLRAQCEAEGMRWLAKQAEERPLQAYSVIGPKEGSPGVWVEKLFVVNVSDKALQIDKVFFDVLKAGTTEEIRDVDGRRGIKLLPQRTWLALSTEWEALPDLSAQSGTAGMLVSGELLANRVEVSRYIEAEVEGK